MARVSIFKIDEFGYPRFTNEGWMETSEAEVILAKKYQGVKAEILTYGQFKARQDTDDMGEAERRRRLGLDAAPAEEKRGVVVTGVIEGMSRKQVAAVISAKGYTPQAGVNTKTAMVIVGANAGRSKVEAAEALGVSLASWSEFAA